MHYLQNHCWCSRSIWDDDHYDCRHLVTLTSYMEDQKEDWETLVDKESECFFDQSRFDINRKLLGSDVPDSKIRKASMTMVPNFKPHVIDWLTTNVADRKDKNSPKGWCIGNASYRNTNTLQLTVFFHRKLDAMRFIKTFSKWGKPTFYHHYFHDVRKKLDVTTLKYETLLRPTHN